MGGACGGFWNFDGAMVEVVIGRDRVGDVVRGRIWLKIETRRGVGRKGARMTKMERRKMRNPPANKKGRRMVARMRVMVILF